MWFGARVCLRVTHCRGLGGEWVRSSQRKRKALCEWVRPCERGSRASSVWRLKIKTIIRFRRYAIKVTSPPPPPKENNSFLFIEFGCMCGGAGAASRLFIGAALSIISLPTPISVGKKAAQRKRKTRRCSRRGAVRHFACCPPLRESKSNGIIKSEQSSARECARG